MYLYSPPNTDHIDECQNGEWYYCELQHPDSHWFKGNRKRPVNWCYDHRYPGARRNPTDADDCPCETIAAHYGEKY